MRSSSIVTMHRSVAGGMSFAHDMGIHNNFSRHGTSSYELPHLKGCFSYMTQSSFATGFCWRDAMSPRPAIATGCATMRTCSTPAPPACAPRADDKRD